MALYSNCILKTLNDFSSNDFDRVNVSNRYFETMRTNCRRVSIFEYAISVELLNNSPRRSDSREKHGGYFRPCVKNGGKINFQEINLINRSMKKRKISDILQSDYNSKRKKKGQEDYFCTFCINLNLHYLNYFQTRNDGYIYISPVKYICEFERG